MQDCSYSMKGVCVMKGLQVPPSLPTGMSTCIGCTLNLTIKTRSEEMNIERKRWKIQKTKASVS